MKKNAGFTLIELVVVIVIIAIVSTTVIINFGVITNKVDATSSLEAIQSCLDAGRYTTMSSKDNSTVIEICKEDNVYYIKTIINDNVDKKEKICSGKHFIYLNLDDEIKPVNNSLKIIYNKSNGSFKSITFDTNEIVPASVSSVAITTDMSDAKLILALNTGRTFIEK